ncbi:MAG: phage portal protein [Methanosarcinaceae archaeon]|nr:phage portal protein [Methanosarcinaceae archaeon]
MVKNFKIVKSSDFKSLTKGAEDLKVIQNYLRPQDENSFFSLDKTQSWGIFDTRVGVVELYQLSVYSDILQNVLNTLKSEIFRNGFNCKNTTTFENDAQIKKVEDLLRKANSNSQTLKEVLMEIENDLNIVDDAYLFARKNFLVNGYNEIIGAEVQEFLRVDPLSIEMVFDSTNRLAHNSDGQPVFFDPENRSEITQDTHNTNGIKNMRACYKVRVGGKTSSFSYYDTSEILHVSKYHPTKTYGFSPLYSLYNKTITLINMDYYIKQYYSGNKVPKGILTVNTSNAQGFWTFWDAFIEKVRKNPHAINPLIHQSGDGKDPIKWVDFMRNLQEMQYSEVRNEIRTQIGSVFNVSPIFQNDTSQGGGLNNEGLQIKVTDRGVEMGQSIYNEKILPWVCAQLGVSDYEIILNPSRDQDKVYEKDLRLKDIQIAKATAELGIEVAMNETGEFSFGAGKVTIQNVAQDSFFDMGKSLGKSIKKNDPIQAKQEKQLENALLHELEKLLSKFDSKTRPTTAELDAKIRETVKDFDSVIKSKSSSKLKAIYRKAMQDLGKDIGREFTYTDVDKNVVEALKREPVYQEAFANMSEELSQKLKNAVVLAYDNKEGFSINNIVEAMKENTTAIESRLRNIARTETTKISVASRKVQYDKTGETYKYYHIGVDDNRTTQASKEIKQLTKSGVSWDDYVSILTRVSKKYFPDWTVNPLAPVSHYQSRHTFIAKKV